VPVDYRPVTWEWAHSMRVNPDALLSAGFTWEFLATPAVAGGASYTIEQLNGTDPVGLIAVTLSAEGTRSVLIETCVGGSVTPGIAVASFPANHASPQPTPVDRMTGGATVDTPGTQIGQSYLGSQDRGVSSASGGALIMAPATGYYTTFTNTDAQSATLHIEMLLARLMS